MSGVQHHQHPPLDRWRFDSIAAGPEKIWGLEAIAKVLGVSAATARRWAKLAEVPIYKPCGAGSYFALRSELIVWLKAK